jgi:hypothetical protein
MGKAYSEHDQKPQFWFNIRTQQVEVGPQSLSQDRIGPFENEQQARDALKLIAERERRRQLEEDENW